MKKTWVFYSPIAIGAAILSVLFFYSILSAKPTFVQTNQGSDTCAECHDVLAAAFHYTPHAEKACTSCHDNPQKHLEEGGGPNIFAFGPEILAPEKSEKCLACHFQTKARFFASPHGKSSMDCTSCHSIHAAGTSPYLLKTSPLKNCLTCHQDIYAQFQLNERHRLQEGILDCTTCHNPHEPASIRRLGGFKQEKCLKCHTDKGGPFLYEHGASRIEGCTACHEVHGSPNRHMLVQQSIADLCFSCHGLVPDFHSRFNEYSTNCTVCHVAIHGSNLSNIFLK
jgi:DmsE family decaheme c-type cytochrome